MKSLPAFIATISFTSLLAACAEPALTIYNQNFAVVRDTVPLDLKAGDNIVRFANATAQVEPDSVILRDPAGKHSLQILEQNYRNDPVSEPLLLSLFEGKTIDFEATVDDGKAGQKFNIIMKRVDDDHFNVTLKAESSEGGASPSLTTEYTRKK